MKPKLPKKLALPRPLRLCNVCGGEEFVPGEKCAFCNSRDLRLAKPGEKAPDRMLIAIGPFGWAVAQTVAHINQKIQNNWPVWAPKQGQLIQLWDCPRSAYVTMQGKLTYHDKDQRPPQLVKEIKT